MAISGARFIDTMLKKQIIKKIITLLNTKKQPVQVYAPLMLLLGELANAYNELHISDVSYSLICRCLFY